MKKWIVCGLGVLCALVLAAGYSQRTSGIPEKWEVAAMTDQEATEALAGAAREAVAEAWGEPDGMLSGLFGDIYEAPGGRHITVYYDIRLNSGPRVWTVSTGAW